MQHTEIGSAQRHLCAVQHIDSLLCLVFFLICEAFALDAGHIKHVEVRNGFLYGADFGVFAAAGGDIILDILRHGKSSGRDEHKGIAAVVRHAFAEGMYRSAVGEIAAHAYHQMIRSVSDVAQRYHVGEGLGRMKVSAVAGVDNRHAGVERSRHRRALNRMPYRQNIGVAAQHGDGVFQAFALCH